MIQLEETTNEYLLQIHASEKERARKIPGRSWDPHRKRWVFPKTSEVLDQLLIEFGDDLEISTEPMIDFGQEEPDFFSKEVSEYIYEIDRESKGLLFEGIASRLKIGTKSVGEFIKQQLLLHILRDRIASLQQKEKAKDMHNATQENTDLWLEIENILKSNDSLRETLGAMEIDNNNLHDEITKLQRVIKATSETQIDFDQMIRNKAISCAGSDTSYSKMIEQMTVNERMSFQLESQMVSILKRILRYDERERITTYDLIRKADEEERITPEAVEFAHIIRRQRNAIAHEKSTTSSSDGRILLSLFASALLWPTLKEIQTEVE